VGCVFVAASAVSGTGTVVCEVSGEDFGAAWEREVLRFFSARCQSCVNMRARMTYPFFLRPSPSPSPRMKMKSSSAPIPPKINFFLRLRARNPAKGVDVALFVLSSFVPVSIDTSSEFFSEELRKTGLLKKLFFGAVWVSHSNGC
jgi:hypothetical protein